MKVKRINSLFILCMSILILWMVNASAQNHDYLMYSISNGEVTITGCDSSATHVVIPQTIEGCTVTAISEHAFASCKYLSTIKIPDTLTSIGNAAFYNCKNLESIEIPNSVTYININTFSGCSKLKSIKIPDSIVSIDAHAFKDCKSLKDVYITDLKAWCNIAFNHYNANPFMYAQNLYINGVLAENITIPHGVESIKTFAFWGCSSLVNVKIPEGVKSIDYSAFYNCHNLESIELPNSLEHIKKDAFYGCTSLKKIELPDKITTIDTYTFAFCEKLRYISLPQGISSIKKDAFIDCRNLKAVFFKGSEEDWQKLSNEDTTILKNTDIIFNAAKRTYRLETNCDTIVPDTTDYAVLYAPVIKVEGKYFKGWYDNESFEQEPVTFPYYKNPTTLYACWGDRTGKSFEEAFELDINKEYTVKSADMEQLVYYEISPKLTGEYKFYSKGTYDTCGYLYNSDGHLLKEDTDCDDNKNFYISYNLHENTKYYVAVKCSGTDFTLVCDTKFVEGTKTVPLFLPTEKYVYIPIPANLSEDAYIMLVYYKDGRYMDCRKKLNSFESEPFVAGDTDYDLIRVFVWDKFKKFNFLYNYEADI